MSEYYDSIILTPILYKSVIRHAFQVDAMVIPINGKYAIRTRYVEGLNDMLYLLELFLSQYHITFVYNLSVTWMLSFAYQSMHL